MASPTALRFFGYSLPEWMRNSLHAVGLVTLLRMVFRYTFAGEYFERLYREAAGEGPIVEEKVA